MGAKRRSLYYPEGSHISLRDDQQLFKDRVVKFVRDVDANNF